MYLARLAEVLTAVHYTGERWWEAELYRLKGDLLLHQAADNAPEAAACFTRAMAIAHKQSAKFWKLRAATSLAGLSMVDENDKASEGNLPVKIFLCRLRNKLRW